MTVVFADSSAIVKLYDDAALLSARHPLRSSGAVQLASALAVHELDPHVATMAVCDQRLRAAAAAEGLAVLPPSRAGRAGGR